MPVYSLSRFACCYYFAVCFIYPYVYFPHKLIWDLKLTCKYNIYKIVDIILYPVFCQPQYNDHTRKNWCQCSFLIYIVCVFCVFFVHFLNIIVEIMSLIAFSSSRDLIKDHTLNLIVMSLLALEQFVFSFWFAMVFEILKSLDSCLPWCSSIWIYRLVSLWLGSA